MPHQAAGARHLGAWRVPAHEPTSSSIAPKGLLTNNTIRGKLVAIVHIDSGALLYADPEKMDLPELRRKGD